MATDAQKLNWARVALSDRKIDQIDQMVEFLGSQEFRLSHRETENSNLPEHVQEIRADIARFTQQWTALEERVREILQQPAESLTTELQEIHLSSHFRLGPAALIRNVQDRRIQRQDGKWFVSGETLWADVERTSLDTAENAHLVMVLRAYEDVRQQLSLNLKREVSEYASRAEEAEKQGSPPRRRLFKNLENRAIRELESLQSLLCFDLPEVWWQFISTPTRENNRTNFDERYRSVADLEDRLSELIKKGASPERRQQIVNLGQRRPWEIYEFWMIAKVCELLERLGFTPDLKDGFAALESSGGPRYGLRTGAQLVYARPDLSIRLSVQWQEDDDRPDLKLDLLSIEGSVFPLFLDAKCKRYVVFSEAAHDLQESARRYAAPSDGTGFLLHPSTLRAWPAKRSQGSEQLQEQDFPFKHGIECLKTQDDFALKRILTAWLVRHGIFWICFQCGHSHRQSVTPLNGYKTIDFSGRHDWKPSRGRFGWICANLECGAGIVLNRCSSCQDHVLIVKSFPTLENIDADNKYWLGTGEVYARDPKKAGARHCCDCGAGL
ncbi:hypothetical protein EHF33_19815 (plasmid) [Deinococcus psychrotolerans]|uniref:Uncharacterized protein n=1 Tax=Deinococcus psychrotolerans TaxID=2489213 RepID=A0A3G8YRJ6_9DEIO|nr:hypothetical protein [Deinococcus psychrotolerans]AZI45164.1 hypothetical protein EHF33_19815 [Deinococcus psychrotolerans]